MFASLHHVLRFTLDAAASAENALCRRFFTVADDALTKPWRGRVWVNPPYCPVSVMAAFVGKGWEEVQAGRAEVVVMLVKATTGTIWWQQDAVQGDVFLFKGRMHFNDGPTPADFPSALVVFSRRTPGERARLRRELGASMRVAGFDGYWQLRSGRDRSCQVEP